jgi:hypothetical protein
VHFEQSDTAAHLQEHTLLGEGNGASVASPANERDRSRYPKARRVRQLKFKINLNKAAPSGLFFRDVDNNTLPLCRRCLLTLALCDAAFMSFDILILILRASVPTRRIHVSTFLGS